MREKLLLRTGWKFHRGDVETQFSTAKGTAYMSAKTERAKQGPACKDYSMAYFAQNHIHPQEQWTDVQIPHDYLAGDGYDPTCNEALGFCHYENAWYVLRFSTRPGDEALRLTLLFEGVATHATVWLNGCLLRHNFCGYTSFEVDITDTVRHDAENVLAVYVNTEEHEGWWYEGAGIYRPVYLVRTEKTAVDLYGVYVKPALQKDGTWCVKTEVTVRNDGDGAAALRTETSVLDADGQQIATAAAGGRIAEREKRVFSTVMGVNAPRLWSPDDPYQYTMRTRVFRGERLVDEVFDRFGFRSFVMDPNEGLFINGKHYWIKGFCGHESVGFCGKAVPDNLQRYRVQLMKEMGANGYRTSHYPQSVALMDALDEAGFIVMDETRWFESTEEGLAQLEMLIRRDRNRPGVFFWSVGNEEPLVCDARGKRIFKTMKAFVRKLDDRPVTIGVTHDPEHAQVMQDCDMISFNYKWDHIDAVHAMYPDKPTLVSECGASGTGRGWYHEEDKLRGLRPAYDLTVNNAFRSQERTWQFIFARPYLCGGYHWNLNEYRGEAVWPRISSMSGAVDLYLQKKDAFWQHQSFFCDTPVVHLLPHWNHRGLERTPIAVWAYTNQPRVELFLNGESFGAREVERCAHAEWQVPYAPGRLEVKAYDADGNTVATDLRETTGAPVRLCLSLDTPEVMANGQDLAILTCTVLDADGRKVPDAEPMVHFIAEGAGRVYSTGAVNNDHTPIFSPDRQLWAGSAAVAVRTGTEPGTCRVTVTSPGLLAAQLTFPVTAPENV